MALTESDWLTAMREAGLNENPEGYSMREIADNLGISRERARVAVQTLVEAGKAKFVGRRPYTRIDGVRGVVPVYRLQG
jgi:DNA-binding Lrp family transcriptional regulator